MKPVLCLWLATATTAGAGKVQHGLTPTPLWLAQPQHLDVGVDLYAHSTIILESMLSVCGRERERTCKRVMVTGKPMALSHNNYDKLFTSCLEE
jgi:hypothetical protein